MTKRKVNWMNEQQAAELARPIVREVVNCIAQKNYTNLQNYAVLESLSLSDFMEEIEGFLELNELPYIDRFDVPCTFKPQYEYQQLFCIVYRDGRGFHVDYDLTTDGERNDLTLQMEFLFTESGSLAAKILQVHVL